MESSSNKNQKANSVEQYRQECTAIAEAEQRSQVIPPDPGRDGTLSFPDSAISGAAGDFADLYSSYLESPKEFFSMSFLTCEGSLLSILLTLDSEITPQPRLYTLLLGESADDRKSTAIQKSVLFFKEFFPDRFNVCSGVGSAEGLQRKLQQTENAGLLLCFDEFKMFVSKCRIESSVLLPCVNTLFENNSYESQTKKGAIQIENAHLSMLAASTIQTYQNVWSPQFTDIGFNNRLFLVPGSAERKFSFPRNIPKGEKRHIINQLSSILRTVRSGKKLKINDAARHVYDGWYLNLERSIFSRRLNTYALRLMSLIAINENKKEVDEETIFKVIQLCNWQLQVRRLHDPIDAENTIAKMEERVRRQLSANGPMTERQLRQKTNADRDGLWAFSTAMGNLQKAGDVYQVSKEERRWRMRA